MRRHSDRQVWWVSFTLFALFGGLWAASLPRLAGPDEPVHAAKAAAVVRGELTWVDRYEVVGTDPGNPSRVETWIIVPRAYASLDVGCLALPPIRSGDCLAPVSDDTTEVAAINSAGSYPPAPYLALGWPSLLLEPEMALSAMRAVHVLLCAAFLASAVVAARRSDLSGMVIVGVAAALTPMVFFLAGVVNPNGLEIATAVCVVCAALDVLAGRAPVATRSIVRLFVAAAVMTLTRPASIVLLVALLGIVFVATATRDRVGTLVRDRRVQVGLFGFVAAAAFTAYWLLSADPLGAVWGTPRPGLTLTEAVRHSFRELPWRTRQMVGVFGWVDAPANLPAWAVAWWVAVVGALAVGALWVGRWRERLAVVGSIIAVVGLTVSESLEAERIGFIWQGRYSLPLTIAIPIVSAFVVGRSGRLPALARRSLADHRLHQPRPRSAARLRHRPSPLRRGGRHAPGRSARRGRMGSTVGADGPAGARGRHHRRADRLVPRRVPRSARDQSAARHQLGDDGLVGDDLTSAHPPAGHERPGQQQ